MPSTTIPGLGLQSYWAEGENGWKPGMDENLVRASVLMQLSVPSVTAALVTGNGVQIAPAGHSNAGQVAAHINGGWWFYPPFEGMRAFVRDVSAWHTFSGGVWAREAASAYVISPSVSASRQITEQEFLVGATIEVNAPTDVVLTVPGPSSAAPTFGSNANRRPVTVVRTGVGKVTIAVASGSTLVGADNALELRAQGSALAIIPLSGNRYLVAGDVA